MAALLPMIAASSSWPPSHALTLAVMRRVVGAGAALTREQPDEHPQQGLEIDEQIESENQDRDDTEDAANEAPHRGDDRADGVGAADRGLFHRLLNRQLPADPPALQQPELSTMKLVREFFPQLARLLDERREDHDPDADDRADDDRIDDENGRPARQPLAARAMLFQRGDERREPDRDEQADVDHQQRISHEKRSPENDDGQRQTGERVTNQRARIRRRAVVKHAPDSWW